MNESCSGALGIPEFMPPDGGETFIVNLHAPTCERTTMNESCSGALGIPELKSPAAMHFHSNNKNKTGNLFLDSRSAVLFHYLIIAGQCNCQHRILVFF